MHLVPRHKAQATEQSSSGRENTRREGDGWPATSPSPSQAAKVKEELPVKTLRPAGTEQPWGTKPTSRTQSPGSPQQAL